MRELGSHFGDLDARHHAVDHNRQEGMKTAALAEHRQQVNNASSGATAA